MLRPRNSAAGTLVVYTSKYISGIIVCVSMALFFLFQCIGVVGLCIIYVYACHSPAQWHGIVTYNLPNELLVAACCIFASTLVNVPVSNLCVSFGLGFKSHFKRHCHHRGCCCCTRRHLACDEVYVVITSNRSTKNVERTNTYS